MSKPKLIRDNMAYVYAGLIDIKDYPFEILNRRIIKKWSKSGLEYIKDRAWKIREQLQKEFN